MTPPAPSRGEARFWNLANALLDQAGVTRSTMMGFPCLRFDGDFFACCDRQTGHLVVKLNEARASALVDAGKAEPFAPNGRRFREWVSVSDRRARSWPTLLDEALRGSAERRPGSLHRTRTPKRKDRPVGTGERQLDRVRRIALALPEVNERRSHGEPCFFVRDRQPLCYYHDDHDGDGRVTLWCPSPPGVQQEFVSAEPARFFKPPPSARGTFATWLGVYLDTTGADKVDWNEIAAIVEDAYRAIAPRTLIAQLDNRQG